jgi:hypothetical protein
VAALPIRRRYAAIPKALPTAAVLSKSCSTL